MTPKFVKTSVRKSENLGEKLSKKRVSLGYEIKDVERAIKIRAKHIEYIENSEWDNLPPDVYVRGFLRSYAKLLKLNPDKVVMIYLKEKGLKENVSKAANNVESSKIKKKNPRIIITPKKITFGSIVLIGLAVLTYIGWQFSILAAPPKLEILTPEDNLKINVDKIIVEGQTDAGAKIFINNFEIGVSPEGSFKEDLSLQNGLNLIRIKAVNRLERETELTRTVIATTGEEGEALELTMVISVGPGASELAINLDGGPVTTKEDNTISPGASQTVKAKEKITITASNAGNVRLKLNDRDLGTLGKDGEKVTKTFTKEDL